MVGNGNQLPQPDILKGGYGPVQEAMRHLVGVQGITEIHQKDACVSVQVVPFFLPADVVEIRGNNEQLISQMTESPVSILEGKHFFPGFLITDAMDAGMLPVAGGWGIAGKGYGLFYLFQ